MSFLALPVKRITVTEYCGPVPFLRELQDDPTRALELIAAVKAVEVIAQSANTEEALACIRHRMQYALRHCGLRQE